MICPKCKSADEVRNFCGNCGEELKEKCPECGQMEWIGRKICESRISKIKNEKESFIDKAMLPAKIVFSISVLMIIFMPYVAMEFISQVLLGLKGYSRLSLELSMAPGVCTAISAGFWWVRREKKAKEKFSQLHPDYDELLKKAEEEK
jgi:hypothetical protein